MAERKFYQEDTRRYVLRLSIEDADGKPVVSDVIVDLDIEDLVVGEVAAEVYIAAAHPVGAHCGVRVRGGKDGVKVDWDSQRAMELAEPILLDGVLRYFLTHLHETHQGGLKQLADAAEEDEDAEQQ